MKLSEAIREGAKLNPQGFGPFSVRSEAKETCAIGAAMKAVGVACDGITDAIPVFPILEHEAIDPASQQRRDVVGIIWRLNDIYKWTRERIADWVETVENQQETNQMTRPLHEIAQDIRADWKKPYFGAVPYIDAMRSLNGINDMYGCDPAKEIVVYFLANAHTWRGNTAKTIKAELKVLAGVK